MQLTFPVVSRFKDGATFEPVTFEQKVFATTRSKIMRYAFNCGWSLENGYADSITQPGSTGGLCFWSADMTRRVNLDFGVKGQITWCCITNQDSARDGNVIYNNRYQAVLSELNAGRAPKAEAPAPKPEERPYSAWIAAKKAKVAEGDVAEFGAWYIDNPSPMQATTVFGEPKTREQLAVVAVREVAHCFKGTKVEVSYSAAPGTWATEGTIMGLATICAGNQSEDAILLQAPSGNLLTIPVSKIVHLANAEA